MFHLLVTQTARSTLPAMTPSQPGSNPLLWTPAVCPAGGAISDLIDQVRRVLTMPCTCGGSAGLLSQADDAYETLLRRAQCSARSTHRGALDEIISAIDGELPAHPRRRLLRHPMLAEGLHELAPG